MAEAEDVILQAAERVTATVRALWRRHRPAAEPPGIALIEVGRRLNALIRACFGGEWPLIPIDPDAVPTWLAMRLRQLPPWVRDRQAFAFSDGCQIFLPRDLRALGNASQDADLLRLTALMFAARLARGSVAWCPTHPVARDLFWAVDGAMAEGALAAEFHGLGASIVGARRFALACRPSLDALKPAERAVELAVQCLLQAPLGEVPGVDAEAPSGLVTPQDIAQWASRAAAQAPFRGQGAYRGVAPVLHWGRPRPDLLEQPAARSRQPESSGEHRPPPRSQRLPHRIEAKALTKDEEGARQGPFLVPHGDPQQSVAEASGFRRPLDHGEESELEALADELARLGQVASVDEDATVQEILEAEGARRSRSGPTAEQADQTAVRLAYPEWDYRQGVYRQGYCVVCEAAAPPGDAQWSARKLREHRRLLHNIRRRFDALRPAPRRDPRQPDGHDLDLDAYVDDFAARRAGCMPSERLYVTDRPRRRDVSVAFLIDASGSTDAWVSGGRRVLDIEKEATLVLCEALEALGDRYAISAFAGRGARAVQVWRIKGFREAYGEAVRARIAGLNGEAFTRLGAPIRHLTACLTRQRARLRLLFVLSDGKPNDEDEYAGAYGIEDTRQAVAEARLQGIHPFCLTIDRQGSIYLPRMFGPQGYSILWEVAQLPQCLPEVYRGLTAAHG